MELDPQASPDSGPGHPHEGCHVTYLFLCVKTGGMVGSIGQARISRCRRNSNMHPVPWTMPWAMSVGICNWSHQPNMIVEYIKVI
jgi:hypothetical protein